MNAGGHLLGAVGAAMLVEVGALGLGLAQWPPGDSQAVLNAWALPATTFLTALFPDLDVASKAQRWYYRFALAALIWLHFTGQDLAFVLLALFSLLPLIHRHRGWTHSLWAPVGISLLLSAALEYHRAETGWFASFSTEAALELWWAYLPFLLAALVGHSAHLLLDSKWTSSRKRR